MVALAKAVGPTGHVVALDIQKAMLNKVREKAIKEDLNNIQYINLDIGTQINRSKFRSRITSDRYW